jgi:hypothetical protein
MNKKTAVSITIDARTGKYVGEFNGQKIRTKHLGYAKQKLIEFAGGQSLDFIVGNRAEIQAQNETLAQFDINQRFSFVEQLVQMIARKQQASVVITGEGGLGKSFTVNKVLKAEGLEDLSILDGFADGSVLPQKRFVTMKGYSTARGLFRFLYENANSVVVFDDCDSILKDKDALNLLKGALDSYDRRIITWNAESNDKELPRAFEFTGQVVFISNLGLETIDQAIKSRSMCVDLSMTVDQKLERMSFIVASGEFLPNYSMTVKREALELISELKDVAKEISLRTLISVSKIRASNPENWKPLATYMLAQ